MKRIVMCALLIGILFLFAYIMSPPEDGMVKGGHAIAVIDDPEGLLPQPYSMPVAP